MMKMTNIMVKGSEFLTKVNYLVDFCLHCKLYSGRTMRCTPLFCPKD